MKFTLTCPTLVLALSLSTHAHKFYRKSEHNNVARNINDQLESRAAAARNLLHPMAEHFAPRQDTISPGTGTGTGTATGTDIPAVPTATSQTYSFSLQATNPTAVPLESINSAAPSAPPGTIASIPRAGETPSNVDGAPGIPAPSPVIANYPPLDAIPPLDSEEVQQWIADVKNSGVEIPDYSLTVAGGCPTNPEAVADPNRCWWTCSGCVRETDVSVCPEKNTWGLSYDDGPAPYTPNLLDYLSEKDLRATFFVVGSRALQFPSMLQSEYMQGHQISVHTWSHHSLTTLSNEEIIAELGWTKKIIHDVLGVTPNSMRPPFGDIDDRVRAICGAMGLTPILWTRMSATQTLDTDDFDVHGGFSTIDEVLYNWQNIIESVSQLDTGFIVLEHDLFQQTVEIATGYILPDALARNQFKIMPVTECLKMPMAYSYIETNDNSINPPPAGSVKSGTGDGNGASSMDGGLVLGIMGVLTTLIFGGVVV